MLSAKLEKKEIKDLLLACTACQTESERFKVLHDKLRSILDEEERKQKEKSEKHELEKQLGLRK